MALWCAFSGAFLGTVDRGRELQEAASFRQDLARPSTQEEWRNKVDLSQGLELDSTGRYQYTAVRYVCSTRLNAVFQLMPKRCQPLDCHAHVQNNHDLSNAIDHVGKWGLGAGHVQREEAHEHC